MNPNLFQQVYTFVQKIPRGRVCSYGQVARGLGLAQGGRQVGWALRALAEGSRVPWYRVINSRGEVSLPGRAGDLQRALLRAEGVFFDSQGRIDLAAFGWKPEEGDP